MKAKELDEKFDAGEDTDDLVDLSTVFRRRTPGMNPDMERALRSLHLLLERAGQIAAENPVSEGLPPSELESLSQEIRFSMAQVKNAVTSRPVAHLQWVDGQAELTVTDEWELDLSQPVPLYAAPQPDYWRVEVAGEVHQTTSRATAAEWIEEGLPVVPIYPERERPA